MDEALTNKSQNTFFQFQILISFFSSYLLKLRCAKLHKKIIFCFFFPILFNLTSIIFFFACFCMNFLFLPLCSTNFLHFDSNFFLVGKMHFPWEFFFFSEKFFLVWLCECNCDIKKKWEFFVVFAITTMENL